MKVKELIKILEKNGWEQARMRGNHRHYRHPEKGGTVTVAGTKCRYTTRDFIEHPQAGWSKVVTRKVL